MMGAALHGPAILNQEVALVVLLLCAAAWLLTVTRCCGCCHSMGDASQYSGPYLTMARDQSQHSREIWAEERRGLLAARIDSTIDHWSGGPAKSLTRNQEGEAVGADEKVAALDPANASPPP